MLSDSHDDAIGPDRAVTHSDCLRISAALLQAHGKPMLPWVQVRRFHRDGPYTLCGRLAALGHSDAEWFKVETEIDTVWARGKDLRMCSGDGRCICEPLTPRPGETGEPTRSTAAPTTQKTQQPCGFQPGCTVQPTGSATR